MRFLKAGLLALCGLLLSACASFQLNVTDLMQSPKSTEDQTEIYEALTTAAGVSDVQLKYPKRGNYRSAFVLFDLDADGEREALVFYSIPSLGGNVRIMVLDRQEEEWVSVYDAVGEGNDVAEIDFQMLTDSGRYSVLIGWERGTSENTSISVYDYTGDQLRVLFESDYSLMLIQDMDQDGIQEILLGIYKASSKTGSIRLINETEEGLESISRVTMDHSITGFLGIEIGDIAPGQTAVFVDAYVGTSEITTEIMAYTASGTLCALSGDHGQTGQSFSRSIPVRCEDINADGILEIPAAVEVQAAEEFPIEDEDEEASHLIQYLQLSNPELLLQLEEDLPQQEDPAFSFSPVWTGFVSLDYGFRFAFPQNWVGMVDVEKEPDRSEWVFCLRSDAVEPPALLRIRVYEQDELWDVFDDVTYARLDNRGTYEYYAAVLQPAEVPASMQISMEEVEEGFSTIKS